ncbi:hypothetical protein U1701_18190 [Sphingomonas sp. PB2P19]|uniref:PilZ domain-containing protein n=1 Tax=Sphingomonas rhamnosi TaxID=3096156 RepID=UPI002FCAB09E
MPTEPSEFKGSARLAADERKAVRIPVDWLATIAAVKFETQPVRIVDCTTSGCRIETAFAVTVGTFVHVAIPKFTEVPGWVAWSRPNAIGIDFSHPLPNLVLEHIIRQNEVV